MKTTKTIWKRGITAVILGSSVLAVAGGVPGAPAGVPCQDASAIKILKSIVDRKFHAQFEVLKDDIVIWDYNPVGRYTCKAKIKKIAEAKPAASTGSADMPIAAIMGNIFAPAQYGIDEEGGWIQYYTYQTTAATADARMLYVEIFSDSEEE